MKKLNDLSEIKVINNANIAMAAARNEMQLEHKYKHIGLAFDINALMLGDGKYQQFTIKYSKFSIKNTNTPSSFTEMDDHIAEFVSANGYTGDKATNAGIWVISRVWKKKFDEELIFDAVIRPEYLKVDTMKKQKTELHKAVNKLANGKAEDSYEAGLKENFKQLMNDIGMHQVSALVTETESQEQLENIKQIAGGEL